ncbi:MAG: cyclic pyranopterin monophosphate synthase MoaC [Methanobacteriota archaeon]|nr:MAG: cyclic pyranopterin monophosphate synthase MoaC [Euryarchaeota archaeon]
MIDIADKKPMLREAIAKGEVILGPVSISHIRQRTNPKGDVLENARLAAIHAVKKTPEFVFMCHPIQITSTKVSFEVMDDRVICTVKVKAIDKTGVEIEAVHGVMAALLAIFDVSKRYEKDETGNYPIAKIERIEVVSKKKTPLEVD